MFLCSSKFFLCYIAKVSKLCGEQNWNKTKKNIYSTEALKESLIVFKMQIKIALQYYPCETLYLWIPLWVFIILFMFQCCLLGFLWLGCLLLHVILLYFLYWWLHLLDCCIYRKKIVIIFIFFFHFCLLLFRFLIKINQKNCTVKHGYNELPGMDDFASLYA